MNRRSFLKIGLGSTLGCSWLPQSSLLQAAPVSTQPLFDISLAQWSLNKSLRAGKLTNLDFPKIAKSEFKIDCIEFVDQFFADKSRDKKYLNELKSIAEGEGVKMGLIMVDTNGPLGAEAQDDRDKAVEKTFGWIDAARHLGCQTVRVNAYGPGHADELRERIVESGRRLADHAGNLNVVIENHGKLSSDPQWLTSVVQAIDRPNFGILPDFGNFPGEINRYDAVEMMMPYAKAVSAKASQFTEDGLVKETDYFRMMRIVRDGGYPAYVGVESGGPNPEGEYKAIRMTRDLLQRIREEQSRVKPIFNGRNLEGWTRLHGGEWAVEDGTLVGRNGQDWTVNPEKSGSWLRSGKTYADFRLELQFMINQRGNSGVFFRSAREKNPAFTGYEMQIYGAPGTPPSKSGPGAIYDVAAPTKNMIRPEGQWNTVTLVARGKKVTVEMNGEQILDTILERADRGYVGLQNHDDRSVVRFRNLRLETL